MRLVEEDKVNGKSIEQWGQTPLMLYKDKASAEELEKYLLEVVYPFAPGAETNKAGGSLDAFKKS